MNFIPYKVIYQMCWVDCFHLSIHFSMVLFGTGIAQINVLSLHMVRKRLRIQRFQLENLVECKSFEINVVNNRIRQRTTLNSCAVFRNCLNSCVVFRNCSRDMPAQNCSQGLPLKFQGGTFGAI